MRIKKGQTTLEFVMLTVIVIGAMVAMQMYVKRAISGRWKDTMETIGEQYDPTAMLTNVRQSLESFGVTVVNLQHNPATNLYDTLRFDTGDTRERKEGSSTVTLY